MLTTTVTSVAELSNDEILLVSGPSESGRLGALRCILAGVSMGATPGDVQLLLTDLRGDGYGDLAKVPHVLDSPISDRREALDSLNNMITEMNSRFDQMSGRGVRNISDLGPDSRRPRIVIAIDELLSLLRTDEAATQQSLIFSRGTRASCRCAHHPRHIDTACDARFRRSNVTEQIAFDTHLISGSSVPRSTLADGRLGPGEFLLEPMESTYPYRRRVVSVTPAEAAALSGHWRGQPGP